ncbi:MAG: sodium:alanine symporter family protein [Eubacteriales bacterium]|nr:sodium:alanine symporter family protein [Eubacteriales bacterium]
MQKIYDILNWIDGKILWGIPMMIVILGSGILLTVTLRFLQVRKFGFSLDNTIVDSVRQMKKKEKKTKENPNAISPFEAFSTAVSGTVGTGNIVGVTTAIISGGPGAVFWMWVSAFFGMVTKYCEITLGLFFRKKDENGEYIGGPMYYIENGLGKKFKWLATLFAAFTMLAAVGMSSVQADTIQTTWKTAFNMPTMVTAAIIAFLTALVILGGIKRIGKVASMIVPFMAVLFMLFAIIIVLINITAVPAALGSIFTSAFTAKSMLGGFLGYGIMSAMRYGFARGIFSNEAGLGSSTIAHSTATQKEPVKQGAWGIFEVFLDTFVICSLTAMVVLTSGIDTTNPNTVVSSVPMQAFGNVFGKIGTLAFSVILPLFAFSTILAWAVYGSKACQYLFKSAKSKLVFNIVFTSLIVVMALITTLGGDTLGSKFVWLVSDMTNALMALPNLIALVALSGLTVKITKNYFARKGGASVEPMLSAYPDLNRELVEKIENEEKE